MTGQVSAAEQLREAEALIGAYKAQISHLIGCRDNPTRFCTELEAERKKLKWQQDRVTRLEHALNDPEGQLAEWHEKLRVKQASLAALRHRAKIELLYRIQQQINAMRNEAPNVTAEAVQPEATAHE